MTPVVKGVLTDLGFDNAVKAQQMFGGHGYIEEWGMSQFVRDARIAMIYEGANGIQALDLVGRKLAQGRRPRRDGLLQRGRRPSARSNAGDEALKPFIAPLQKAPRPPAAGDHVVHAERHGQARQCRRRRDRLHAPLRPRRAWATCGRRMAKAALAQKANGDGAAAAWTRSSLTGRFFMERLMPETGARLARITDGRRCHDGDAGGGVLTATGCRADGWIRRPVLNDDSGAFCDRDGRTMMPGRPAMPEAFIYDAVRTPRGRGKPDGALHEVHGGRPRRDDARCASAQRNDLDPELVEDVVLGCVDPVGEAGGDIARAAVLKAGFGKEVPGVQINRFCASGLDAVNLAAAQVMAGHEGHRHRRRRRIHEPRRHGRLGRRLAGRSRHRHPSYFMPQGISADLIATKYGFSRDDVDAYAVESQKRAAQAWDEGRFAKSVVPVRGHQRPDHPRPRRAHAAVDRHAVARPAQAAFVQMGEMGGFDAVAIAAHPEVEVVNHVHHAGNSSGIVDGAAAVLVGSRRARRKARPEAARAGSAPSPRIGSDPR